MTEYSSNQPFGKEWTEKERKVPRPLTSTEASCPALPNAGCCSIVRRAYGPSIAVIIAEALAGVPPLRPHQQGKSTRPGNAPRRNPGPDGLAGFVPPTESTAHLSGPAIRTRGRPRVPVRLGIKVDAERFARPAPHRSVAADFGLRHLVRSRSDQPLDRRSGPACRGYI